MERLRKRSDFLAAATGGKVPTAGFVLQARARAEDGPARVVSVRVMDRSPAASLLEVVMGEGRNREVRRLLAAVGHEVEALARTAIGPIRDQELVPGKWRSLTTEEVRSLYRSTGGEK